MDDNDLMMRSGSLGWILSGAMDGLMRKCVDGLCMSNLDNVQVHTYVIVEYWVACHFISYVHNICVDFPTGLCSSPYPFQVSSRSLAWRAWSA
jgi:hypothetical protein